MADITTITQMTTAATFAFPPMRDGTPHVPEPAKAGDRTPTGVVHGPTVTGDGRPRRGDPASVDRPRQADVVSSWCRRRPRRWRSGATPG